MRRYHDFKIELDLADDGTAVEVTVDSRHGETINPVDVRMRPDELAWLRDKADQLMERGLHADERVRFGQRLARLLVPRDVEPLLFRALDALGEEEGIRLRLVINASELAVLPWEYTYVSRPGEGPHLVPFLALDPRVSIVRHDRQVVPIPTLLPVHAGRFSVLVASASRLPGYPSLGGQNDAASRAALSSAEGVTIDVRVIPDPVTRPALKAAATTQFDAFQFIGHGVRSGADGPGGLVVGGDDGVDIVDPEALAALLRQADVRVAVLSACHTGSSSTDDRWNGMASALVRAGIPAVVAMQHLIENSHALAFESGLYSALAAGLSLDEAVALGRRKINDLGILANWGVPVLYSRGDGIVFTPGIGANGAAEKLRSELRTEPIDFSEGLELESDGHWTRAASFYERQLGRAIRTRDRAELGLRIGACRWRDGRVEDAKEVLSEARQLANEAGDKLLLGKIQLEFGIMAEDEDMLQDAAKRYTDALALLQDSPLDAVRVQLNLVQLQRRRGELRTARETLAAIDATLLPPDLEADYYDAKGALLIQRGEFREAIDVLERALELDELLDERDGHRTAKSRLLLAEACLGCGHRTEAVNQVELAIDIYREAHDESGLSEAYAMRGLIHEEAGEYQKALRVYQRAGQYDAAVEDRGGQARVNRLLGRTARKRGDMDAAEEYFNAARGLLAPGRSHDELEVAALHTEEGLLDLDAGNYRDAIAHLQVALDIALQDEDERAIAIAQRNLASALHDVGELERAVELLRAARPVLEERGDLRELEALLDDLGEVLLDLGDYEHALDALMESAKLDDEIDYGRGRGRTQLLLGRAHLQLGRRTKAADYLRAALETYEELEDQVGCSNALYELGLWATDEGRSRDAKDYLTKALRIDRKQSDRLGIVRCHRALAAMFLRSGDWLRASDHLSDARSELEGIDDRMEVSLVMLERARLALVRGETREAVELAEEAREGFESLGTPVPAARAVRVTAKARAAQGDLELALELLEGVLGVFKDRSAIAELSEAWDDIAQLHLMAGNLTLATEAVEESLRLDRETNWHSSQGRSLLIKAEIENRSGRKERARDLYTRALESFEDAEDEIGQAEVYDCLGCWHLENVEALASASYEQAARFLKEARRLFQKHQDPRGTSRTLRHLGELYFARSEPQRAEEAFEQAEELLGALHQNPELAPLALAQGRVAAALGQHHRAISFFESALKQYQRMRREDMVNDVLRRLATAHQNNGDFERALDCIRQIGLERARLWTALIDHLHPEVSGAVGSYYREAQYDRAVEKALDVARSWMRDVERQVKRDPGIVVDDEVLALAETTVELFGGRMDDGSWQPSSVEAVAVISLVHLLGTFLQPAATVA